MVSLTELDAWINKCVHDVGKQLPKQCEDGEHQRQGHDGRVITADDGKEEQLTHARPVKNLLQDDGATEQAWPLTVDFFKAQLGS